MAMASPCSLFLFLPESDDDDELLAMVDLSMSWGPMPFSCAVFLPRNGRSKTRSWVASQIFRSITFFRHSDAAFLSFRQHLWSCTLVTAFVFFSCEGDRVVFGTTCSSLGLRGSVPLFGMFRPFEFCKSQAHPLSGLMSPVELILVVCVWCSLLAVKSTVCSAVLQGYSPTCVVLVTRDVASDWMVRCWLPWPQSGLGCWPPMTLFPGSFLEVVPVAWARLFWAYQAKIVVWILTQCFVVFVLWATFQSFCPVTFGLGLFCISG